MEEEQKEEQKENDKEEAEVSKTASIRKRRGRVRKSTKSADTNKQGDDEENDQN